MAALDVLEVVVPAVGSQATSRTVTFSALNAGDLILFFTFTHVNSMLTAPAGLTLLESNTVGAVPFYVHARVVQSGDATGWAFSTLSNTRWYHHAYRIEGPFTDLSGVASGPIESSATMVTSSRILASDVSVDANTLVIAAIGRGIATAVSFTNSFAEQQALGAIESLNSARRLYTSADTTVSTTVSWTTSTNPARYTLVRIESPSAPPSGVLRPYMMG